MFRSLLRSTTSGSRSVLASHAALHPSSTLTSQLIAVRLLSTETRAAIQKAVDSSPMVVFMKGTPDQPQCGFSRAVVQIMELHGVIPEKVKTYNVLEDPELRNGIKEFSEWPTIPQVYVNGEFVGGCDIVLGLHQSGELEELLEKHEIIPKIPADAAPNPSS
ncbi:monothiol glutaredoxin-5 [Sistotremastrum niveocremeum HHB9708]|uniref:Monothiol glutaredoxin-5, mitochondrial n=1 Tax=Sistotremastrum niveocremeum HHB9708 TaxID=1314777 RepID=A0A164VRL9_9AGAM|nr:monothiol glutaredoxin-5 [Sistotremastrum niveocremeum HHB9708]